MLQPLCIETIAVENRQFKNLAYHEARLNKTRKELWGYEDDWKLQEMLNVPDLVTEDLHKCRLTYNKEVDSVKWEPYTPRVIRKIKKVYDDSVDYSYKYDQRPELNLLFAQREEADEILIIKQGMVTDTFYCNAAFLKDKKWFTPATYLLPGTQRAFLLDSGFIEEARISESDIADYSHIRLFNAMVGWENAWELEIKRIN